jgi:hypothetical protein
LALAAHGSVPSSASHERRRSSLLSLRDPDIFWQSGFRDRAVGGQVLGVPAVENPTIEGRLV